MAMQIDWRFKTRRSLALTAGTTVFAGVVLAFFAGVWVAGAWTAVLVGCDVVIRRLEKRGPGGRLANNNLYLGLAAVVVAGWIVHAALLWGSGTDIGAIGAVVDLFAVANLIIFKAIRSRRRQLAYLAVPLGLLAAFLVVVGWTALPAWAAAAWTATTVGTVLLLPHLGAVANENFERLQSALADAEARRRRFAFLVEVAGDGYLEVDLARGTYTLDAKLAALTGSGAEPLDLNAVHQLVHPDDRARTDAHFRAAVLGEQDAWQQELRVRDAEGRYRWMQTRMRVIERSGGRALSIVASLVDLTRWKDMEEELIRAKDAAEESNRAKSRFLANVSHEIRTPLNGVLGMAQSLRGQGLTRREAGMVDTILESGRTLTGLLNDVLDLAKVEAGRLDIASEPARLLDLVEDVARLFRPRAEAKGVELAVFAPADFPEWLMLDPLRVRQCVVNLVSNAVKFTDSGSVRIALFAEAESDGGAKVCIKVTDTGIGIPPSVIERVFEPFTQADAETTRRFGGSGLGLAIALKLARMMEGDVSVQSVPGQGSTFRLTLSTRVASPAQPKATAAAVACHCDPAKVIAGARLLLVDDHAVNRQVVKLLLAQFRPVFAEAANGREALEELGKATFDAVLMDLHMPVMDGEQAVRAIRASDAPWRAIPVIGLTADAMAGDRERVLAMGMDDYAAKPLDQLDLACKIARLLSGEAVEAASAPEMRIAV